MACAKRGCDNRGKLGLNIVGHGSFPTKWGRRWRYRCTVCGGPVSTNTGTAYSGRRCARREFAQGASLRVEGVSMSATARVTGHSRHTLARWLERHPVTDRAVGVVIERIHSRTLEAAVGPLAVPPLPDRRRALRHRVGTSIDGVGGAAGRLAAHPQLDGVQVGYETNSKLASEWQLLLSHTPLQSPARRDLAGACTGLLFRFRHQF